MPATLEIEDLHVWVSLLRHPSLQEAGSSVHLDYSAMIMESPDVSTTASSWPTAAIYHCRFYPFRGHKGFFRRKHRCASDDCLNRRDEGLSFRPLGLWMLPPDRSGSRRLLAVGEHCGHALASLESCTSTAQSFSMTFPTTALFSPGGLQTSSPSGAWVQSPTSREHAKTCSRCRSISISFGQSRRNDLIHPSHGAA